MVLLPLAVATALWSALAAALTIDVTVEERALAAHDGTAVIRGTVTCSAETLVTLEGQMVELLGRIDVAAGTFATEVACGTTPTAWTVTVASDTGVRFRPGFASADLMVTGFDPESGVFTGVQSLVLLHLTRSMR